MFLRKFYQIYSGKIVPIFAISFSISSMQLLEMFKVALNNYSVLKLHFFKINTHTFAMYCKNVSHQYYATNQNTKPHILLQNCPKIGQSNAYLFYLPQLLLLRSFFHLKGKLKDIIYFPYEISNDIIQFYQFSRRILTLLALTALMSTDITRYYWTNGTQSLKSMNPIHKVSIDLSRI